MTEPRAGRHLYQICPQTKGRFKRHPCYALVERYERAGSGARFPPLASSGEQIRVDAAVQAARTRLRPILMTSFAFILGVVPLAIATGAGAEMRQSLGTAVFFGMLGVTGFGLVFTPAFYVVVRGLFAARKKLETVGAAQPLAKTAE